MKEIRFDAADGVWRFASAFDANRQAIILCGGDKSGSSERRFYRQLIAKADERFDAHVRKDQTGEEGKEAMTMKNLDRIRQEMNPARRRKINARAAAIMAEEMTLRELRRALTRTQTTVGEILGIGQEGVSRIEQRSDLLLSTLRSYVEAMGGNLSLIVEFPDREPVSLSGIGMAQTNAPPHAARQPQPHRARVEKSAQTHKQAATVRR